MRQESSTEFHQRWIATAETDMQSAKRSFVIWLCVFIPITAAFFSITEFLPKSGWRTLAGSLLCLPYLISFVKVATGASSLGDAKRFLRECRNGLANQVQNIR
jgi:hypothetical protein